MSLALISRYEDPDLWRRELAVLLPGVDFRVFPELGDLGQIRMAAFDYDRARPELLAGMSNLGCIVFLGHGANDFMKNPALPAHVPVMRLKDPGIIGFMVEYMLLHVLSHLRRQDDYRRQQAERTWNVLPWRFASRTTVGVMGLGSIGERTARVFADLGFQVRGWARGPHEIAGVECLHGRDRLAEFLAPCDYVLCVLPGTDETRNMLDAKVFGLMKEGSLFVNVGRGSLVVESDLLAALDKGRPGAAVLDVFQTEPLPRESALWRHPKVTVTPHESGGIPEGSVPHIAENYRRLLAGEPLMFIADRSRGY